MSNTRKFEGVLWYGEQYPKFYDNRELKFQMEVEEVGDHFSGIAKDISGLGMSPDQAVVAGMISDTVISFEKKYRRAHYSDKDGNLIIDEKREGLPILYEGIFNPQTGFYEGKWKYNAVRRHWLFFWKSMELGSGKFQLKSV